MHAAGVSPMVGPGGGTWDPGPTRVPLGRSGWNDRRSAGTEGVGRRGVHEALVRGWQPLRLGSSHWKALWLTGKRWNMETCTVADKPNFVDDENHCAVGAAARCR